MATRKRPAEKSLMEKIGETMSHVKDVIVEKKDDLVEVVEQKVTSIKNAIGRKKKKTTPRKAATKKKAAAKKKTPAKRKSSAKKKTARSARR
jgi:hypothetical protein